MQKSRVVLDMAVSPLQFLAGGAARGRVAVIMTAAATYTIRVTVGHLGDVLPTPVVLVVATAPRVLWFHFGMGPGDLPLSDYILMTVTGAGRAGLVTCELWEA